MRAAVVIFPGSNRERDMALALERAFGRPPLLIWHKESDFPDVDLVVLPGGFSYGDYLRCGAMAAHAPVMREVARRAQRGVPVLGVCNGFQILTEARLLPGVLLQNAGLRFICRQVRLRVERGDTLFAGRYRQGQVLSVPVAHMEGRYHADPETHRRLEEEGRVAFRYVDEDGLPTQSANPNGSLANIAGLYSENLRILGLMPHPEDAVEPRLGGEDGLPLFQALAEALVQ